MSEDIKQTLEHSYLSVFSGDVGKLTFQKRPEEGRVRVS